MFHPMQPVKPTEYLPWLKACVTGVSKICTPRVPDYPFREVTQPSEIRTKQDQV